MARKLSAPTVEHQVWIHIDKINRRDGRIWAVQYCPPKGHGPSVYYAVTGVVCTVPTCTSYNSTSQPRAWLQASAAKVTLHGSTAVIEKAD